MRVAALYDIHGNAPALEAVLRELGAVAPDVFLIGGDVAAGPLPDETLDLLRGLGSSARFVRGNGDREPFDRWLAHRLSAEDRAFLASFEERVMLDVIGLGPTLFCHGSPRSDEEIVTEISTAERLRPILAGVNEGVVVCGHTHVGFDRVVDGTRLVNAGSVGMPYEAEPGAYWALFGPDVELRRTAYDLDRAAERIRSSGWHGAEEFVAENLFTVPGREEATELFERMALES